MSHSVPTQQYNSLNSMVSTLAMSRQHELPELRWSFVSPSLPGGFGLPNAEATAISTDH